MASPNFRDTLRSGRVLVADGATGTNYQARGLERGVAPEQWLFDSPEEVVRLHRDFVRAGSDIVLTDTFGATPVRLTHSGVEQNVVEVNRRAVELARKAAEAEGTQVLVAGSMGPSGQLLDPFGPLSHDDAVRAFAEQAQVLAEAGVDLLVIETQFDLGEAKAAIEGARSKTDLPIVCSFSFDMGSHTMMGLTPRQVTEELERLDVDAIGINCGRSLDENLQALSEMRAVTAKPIWFKPNAGLPRMTDDDQAVYDVTPELMGQHAEQWIAAGANIVGGCCGTSPEHLAAIAAAAKKTAKVS